MDVQVDMVVADAVQARPVPARPVPAATRWAGHRLYLPTFVIAALAAWLS